ncbi:hypothetical protein GH733_018436, partial [Mirounga leonina]
MSGLLSLSLLPPSNFLITLELSSKLGPPGVQLALRLFQEAQSNEELPDILHSGRSKHPVQDSLMGW